MSEVDRLRALADEQAAVLRAAELVARAASPAEVLTTVTAEASRLLRGQPTMLLRFDGSRELVVVASHGGPAPVGRRIAFEPDTLPDRVLRRGAVVRVDDYTAEEDAELARAVGLAAAVAAPVSVAGAVWGMLIATSPTGPLPAVTEPRLDAFARLVTAALGGSQARTELKALADEQAALRRVAELSARGASADDVLQAVAVEGSRLSGVDFTTVLRYEPDGSTEVVALDGGPAGVVVGMRASGAGDGAAQRLWRTGGAARVDDLSAVSGHWPHVASGAGYAASVAVPIPLEGTLWGALLVVSRDRPLPRGIEEHLQRFGDLVGSAISAAEARLGLRALAEEQAALRRVAELVARGAAPEDVFVAVAVEASALLGDLATELLWFEGDEAVAVAACNSLVPLGLRVPSHRDTPTGRVLHTALPVRADTFDDTPFAELAREVGLVAGVAVPVVVEGRVLAALTASSSGPPLPADTEGRLAQFAELTAVAIANAEANAKLTASRARVVATADETRRRLQRDVHDGAQQRLVHAVIALKMARSTVEAGSAAAGLVEEALSNVERAAGELRDIVHGILPRSLTYGGLRVGLESLVAGLALPIDMRVATPRLPAAVETTAYFVVAETLTNAVKHAQAQRVGLSVELDGDTLVVEIRDDGVGGADPARGTGLTGLADRVDAAGGILVITSPAGEGTTLRAVLPVGPGRRPEPAGGRVPGRRGRLVPEGPVDLHRLAESQAALRRIAAVAAAGSPPHTVFWTVTAEASALLGGALVALARLEKGGAEAVVLAQTGDHVTVGTRIPVAGETTIARMRRSGRTEPMDGYVGGPGTELIEQLGIRAGVSVPVIVDGNLWGALGITSRTGPLPVGIEDRLAVFVEILAAAAANAEARESARVLAAEQAALRRVAALVAEGAGEAEIFDAVAEEAAGLIDDEATTLVRYEGDRTFVVLAHRSGPAPVGMRFTVPPDDAGTLDRMMRTLRPARLDRYDTIADRSYSHRDFGVGSSVSVPVVVDGRLWGSLGVLNEGRRLPPETEERLGKFAELVASALANVAARAELERFGARQAALRRVAELVARGAALDEVFEAVATEASNILDETSANLFRFDADGLATVVAVCRSPSPLGARIPTDPAGVRGTGGPVRFTTLAGTAWADGALGAGVTAMVAVPVVVEGRIWGGLASTTSGNPPPADTEDRLTQFADLAAAAIANAENRAKLRASRARVVATADETRQRLQRDVHDGAQQRLVQTVLALKLGLAAAARGEDPSDLVLEALEHAERATVELRDIVHGILPASLTRGGLRAGIDSLVATSVTAVDVDVAALPSGRLPGEVEVTAYFVVAEALTNVAKHARATRARVTVAGDADLLSIEVSDDGVGGADPRGGSGLTGLLDRVDALDGTLRLTSAGGAGTTLRVTLPLTGARTS